MQSINIVGVKALYNILKEIENNLPFLLVNFNKASEFLNITAKPNNLILKEHWDESLPNLNKFKINELPLYNFDSTKKSLNLSTLLSESDYLVIFSNRLYGTIPRLPERYPFTSNYYEKLFDGSLGYSLIHQEKNEPKLFGIKYTNDNFFRIPINPPKIFSEPNNSPTLSFVNGDFILDFPPRCISG